jgi:predicted 2-oxoglutarate/Fe(II)-dependent dioxygenase YbiX
VIEPGDPAPLFVAPTEAGQDFYLSSAAGDHVVLTFVDGRIVVSLPAADHVVPDDGGVIAARYGLAGVRRTVVLDARLRVLDTMPVTDATRLADALAVREDGTAPHLVVPRVLEPELCRRLVAEYDRVGGADSGFVRGDEHGRTVPVVDHTHKRRRDVTLTDPALRAAVRTRLERRLGPELRKAFQFTATRVERYLVACYDAADGGHFRPHRDNTTGGTAHRAFAVTINLNAGYTGGDLRFPEFGPRTYRAPLGGALVFSCSLLHEVLPVTEGRRYCTLPFLYDEAGEELRKRNLAFVAGPVADPDPEL